MVLVFSNSQKLTFTPCNFPQKTTGKKHLWTGLPSSCQSSLSPGAARQWNQTWKSAPLKGKTNLPNICLEGFHVHFPRSNLDFHSFVLDLLQMARWFPTWVELWGRRHLIYPTSSHDFAKLDEIWIMSRCRSPKIQQTWIVLACFGALLGCCNGLCLCMTANLPRCNQRITVKLMNM